MKAKESANENLPVTTKTIVDEVLVKVTNFKETGELVLPPDYSAENALKSAYLILTEAVTKDKVPVLTACTKASIANTLLNMVVQGLSPMKMQCYFIPYGDKLQLSRSYLGSIAVARRVGLDDIVANVVYEDDEFSYSIDSKTGRFNIIAHEQDMSNIDIAKIRGAYAITTMQDGTSNVTVMTIQQIKTAWLQGYAKGKSGAHENFTDEMAKKTVISRACKLIINSSTDAMLEISETDSTENEEENLNLVPKGKVNRKPIEISVEPEDEEEEPQKKQKAPETEIKAEF